jgi:ATP-dependent RNA helicase RhlE
VAPQEESELRAIERAVGKRLPRVILPDFDYKAKPEGVLEVPIAQRIAEIRKRKAEERARAKINAERRAAHQAAEQARGAAGGPKPKPGAGRSRGPRGKPRPR